MVIEKTDVIHVHSTKFRFSETDKFEFYGEVMRINRG